MRSVILACLFTASQVVASPPQAAAPDRPHALAAQAAQQRVARCPAPNVPDAAHCHQRFQDGCETKANPQYDPYLAFLKNQMISPKDADAQIKRTFTSLTDFRTIDQSTQPFGSFFGNGKAAGHAPQLAASGAGEIDVVIGYLYYADPTQAEACNCDLTKPADTDIHIGIGFDSALAAKITNGTFKVTTNPRGTDDGKRTSIVVEMTPHYRVQFHQHWTQPAIAALKGRRVKVVGQLIADADHNDKTQDCAFTNAVTASCWRAAIWEIHPVTRFFVCAQGKTCTAANSPDWQEIP